MIIPCRPERAPPRAAACRRPTARIAAAGVLALLSVLLAPASADSEDRDEATGDREVTELRATGMTFVGSRDDTSELVLYSRFATFYPDRDFAKLEEVRAVVTDDADGDSFEMTCDRAELNVETNDFRAEGRVRGKTADGQTYAAPWVEYEHEAGVLHTDSPVKMVDATGTFRGDGFRYHVDDRKFKLLGNVSVEQR